MSRIVPPTVAELIAALPDDEGTFRRSSFEERLSSASRQAIPTGFSRFGATTSLSLKIGLGYFAYWAKSWFQDAGAKHADLLEDESKIGGPHVGINDVLAWRNHEDRTVPGQFPRPGARRVGRHA